MRAENGNKPPGAAPRIQGYWAAVWKLDREPPNTHPGHTEQWKQEWLKGYDEAKQFV